MNPENRNNQKWIAEKHAILQCATMAFLFTSVLFLGYVQVIFSWLGIVVCFIGLSSSIAAAMYLRKIAQRINGIEKELEKELEGPTKASKASKSPWLPSVFIAVLWLCSLSYTIIEWDCQKIAHLG